MRTNPSQNSSQGQQLTGNTNCSDTPRHSSDTELDSQEQRLSTLETPAVTPHASFFPAAAAAAAASAPAATAPILQRTFHVDERIDGNQPAAAAATWHNRMRTITLDEFMATQKAAEPVTITGARRASANESDSDGSLHDWPSPGNIANPTEVLVTSRSSSPATPDSSEHSV